MISVEDVLRLDAWIGQGPDEEERKARIAKVREVLFDGRNAEEVAEIVRVIEEAQRRQLIDEVVGVAAIAPPAEKAVKKRAKLYDPKRRGYMRSSREEGIGKEIDEMNEEAHGSPFFDAAQPAVTPVRGDKATLVERLRRLTGSG